jgi:hypothetical protein
MTQPRAQKQKLLTCGLIMPISPIDGCSAEHWSDVKSIVAEAVEGITIVKSIVKLVSDADDVGVIQKRIVQNVYNSDVIVCDVSGKNPNVMFELGLRLAFDKPTVIIKDDKTDYAFDTGIIEHVSYPRDLHFHRMVAFKTLLADKVLATYNAARTDPGHSTFLKNFGEFQVAELNQKTVPTDKYLTGVLSDIQVELSRLRVPLPRGPDRGRDRRTEREIEGTYRIEVEVAKYLAEKPTIDVGTIGQSEEFVTEMEQKTHAPDCCQSRGEFKDALVRVLEIESFRVKGKATR